MHAQLLFVMPAQEQTDWCWAAVSDAVARFYNPACGTTQCNIAGATLARSDCCTGSAPSPCNIPWKLDRSLGTVHHLNAMSTTPTAYATVRDEIDAGNPVCARIAWPIRGGHFIALSGYFDATAPGGPDLVDVADPLYGPSRYSFTALNTSYQGTGQWSHTYTCTP